MNQPHGNTGKRNAAKDQDKKGIKKSLSLSATTKNWVMLNNPDCEEKWSAPINAAISHFSQLLKNALPDLSDDEWKIILNTYAGCDMPAYRKHPLSIAKDIMDDLGVIDINALSNDHLRVVLKLHDLSQIQQLAILYVAQIFWLNELGSQPLDAIIAEIKSRF